MTDGKMKGSGTKPKTPRRKGASSDISVPMHEHVRQTLAQRMADGTYPVGSMIPSEFELCRLFSVSRITVRQALSSLANEGLLIKQPGRGTFVREAQAKQSEPRAKTIGLILTNAIGSFMSQLIHGVEAVAREAGYALTVAIAHDDPEQERKCIDQMIERRVSGVLLLPVDTEGPSHPNCFDYLRIQAAGIPLIFVDRHLSQLPVGYVVGPDESGMKQLTEHLIAQGYIDIGYIHHDITASSVIERQKGFVSALLAHRLHPAETLVVHPPRGDRSDTMRGYEVVRNYLASGKKPPRALVGCNSYFVIGALRALTESGYRVPEDVALAGFDDLPECEVVSVPMTVLRIPIEGMGSTAAQHLIRTIEQGVSNVPLVGEKVKGELVIRESCGAMQKVGV